MKSYILEISCLHCGALLTHTAGSKPHPRNVSVIADCTTCGSTFRLDVVLTVLNGVAIRQIMPPPTASEMGLVNRDAPGQAVVAALMAAEDEDIARARAERKRLNNKPVAA